MLGVGAEATAAQAGKTKNLLNAIDCLKPMPLLDKGRQTRLETTGSAVHSHWCKQSPTVVRLVRLVAQTSQTSLSLSDPAAPPCRF